MKTLLNFYPKYYPRLSCTMIDVSAHYGIPPPKKISSYAFIVYYTKYLIFILSDLLKSIISAYYTCKGTLHLAQKLSLDAFVKQVANTFGQKFKKGSERCIPKNTLVSPQSYSKLMFSKNIRGILSRKASRNHFLPLYILLRMISGTYIHSSGVPAKKDKKFT